MREERAKREKNRGRKSALGPRGAAKSMAKGRDYGYQGEITSYYMITVNCKYRKRIHDMLKELRGLNQKRMDLEDKYGPLKRDLKTKVVKAYKAVKGDEIDELFAKHINAAQLDLPIKRLASGKYLFGTRNIIAKIVNGKLLIRVGGGFMSADEFIEQYGRMEMLKIMHQKDPNFDFEKANRMT